MAMNVIFHFSTQLYALPGASVKELFKLPKLTAVEDSLPCLAGTLNCRGKIIAVFNFAALIGNPHPAYALEDVVIVLEHADRLMAIVVSEVCELQDIQVADIAPMPDSITQDGHARLICGQVNGSQQELITVIDVAALFCHPVVLLAELKQATDEQHYQANPSASAMIKEARPAHAHFPWRQFAPAAQQILQQRAGRIASVSLAQDLPGTKVLAMVRMGREIFGINIECVQEFTNIQRVALLPSCPAHIAGSMNLRGDALTLLDLRAALHLDTTQAPSRVVVMRAPPFGLFGILVESVEQVSTMQLQDASQLPAGLRKFEETCLSGLVRWGDKEVPVLDIVGLLEQVSPLLDEVV